MKSSNHPSYDKLEDLINNTYLRVESSHQGLKVIWSDAYGGGNGNCNCLDGTVQCPAAIKNSKITVTNFDNTQCEIIFPTGFGGGSSGFKDKFIVLPLNCYNMELTNTVTFGCNCFTICLNFGGEESSPL